MAVRTLTGTVVGANNAPVAGAVINFRVAKGAFTEDNLQVPDSVVQATPNETTGAYSVSLLVEVLYEAYIIVGTNRPTALTQIMLPEGTGSVTFEEARLFVAGASAATSAAQDLLTSHTSASDPHPQYLTEANAALLYELILGNPAADGYALVSTAAGVRSWTALATALPPSGAAGGVLGGTYPNPGFAVDMATQAELDSHTNNVSNPHSVTAAQAGAEPSLGNPDVNGKVLASTVAGVRSWVDTATQTELDSHTNNVSNPHSVTAAQVGAITQTEADARYIELTDTVTAAQHGNQTSESLHALATSLLHGFMPKADKAKLDLLTLATAAAITNGGTLNLGGFTATVPATGTLALREASNVFSVAQSIRGGDPSTLAAGLVVGWTSGDSLPTARFGSASSGNNQIAVLALADATHAIRGVSNNGATLRADRLGAAGSTSQTVLDLRSNPSTGTQQNGAGLKTQLRVKTNTTADQLAGEDSVEWSDATDATRTARRRLYLTKNGTTVEAFQIDHSDSATQSNILLLHNGALKRVLIDSMTGMLSVAV